MPNTYTQISSNTVSSPTTTYTLSSIPSTYTDLILVMHVGNTTTSGSAIRMRLNGDSGNYYSTIFHEGLGTVANSNRETGAGQFSLGWQIGISSSAINSTWTFTFPNYSVSNFSKTYLAKQNNYNDGIGYTSGLWRDNTPINSISFNVGSFGSSPGAFLAGSTFNLYGVTVA